MTRSFRLAGAIALAWCLATLAAAAAAQAADEVRVETTPTFVLAHPPADDAVRGVRLRVLAPDGTLVAERRSQREAVTWTPTSEAHGIHRYELVVFVDAPVEDRSEEASSGEPALEIRSRHSGILEVTNGAIRVPTPAGSDTETGASSNDTTGGSR